MLAIGRRAQHQRDRLGDRQEHDSDRRQQGERVRCVLFQNFENNIMADDTSTPAASRRPTSPSAPTSTRRSRRSSAGGSSRTTSRSARRAGAATTTSKWAPRSSSRTTAGSSSPRCTGSSYFNTRCRANTRRLPELHRRHVHAARPATTRPTTTGRTWASISRTTATPRPAHAEPGPALRAAGRPVQQRFPDAGPVVALGSLGTTTSGSSTRTTSGRDWGLPTTSSGDGQDHRPRRLRHLLRRDLPEHHVVRALDGRPDAAELPDVLADTVDAGLSTRPTGEASGTRFIDPTFQGQIMRLTSPNLVQPWAHHFNVGGSRQITPGFAIDVDYVHSIGKDEIHRWPINRAENQTPSSAGGRIPATVCRDTRRGQSRPFAVRRAVFHRSDASEASADASQLCVDQGEEHRERLRQNPSDLDNLHWEDDFGPAPNDVPAPVHGRRGRTVWNNLHLSSIIQANTGKPFEARTGCRRIAQRHPRHRSRDRTAVPAQLVPRRRTSSAGTCGCHIDQFGAEDERSNRCSRCSTSPTT